MLTGLRKGELESLHVSSLALDAAVPHVILPAADEKSRQGTHLVLRPDLVDDLRAWLAFRLARAKKEAKHEGLPLAADLPPETPLFYVPRDLRKILDRDLKMAGIPKRDERGWTVDVHALRHTFGTHLSKAGVPLRTAQAAMRHSDPKLTANVYTDPKQLDILGAVGLLPSLPLPGGQDPVSLPARSTAADGGGGGGGGDAVPGVTRRSGDGEPAVSGVGHEADVSPLAPTLAPKTGNTCPSEAKGDRVADHCGGEGPPPHPMQPLAQTNGSSPCQLVTRAASCRGERIRTSDLLNPIQACLSRNIRPTNVLRHRCRQLVTMLAQHYAVRRRASQLRR